MPEMTNQGYPWSGCTHMRRSVSCRSAVEPQSRAHLSFVIAGCCTRNMLQKWFCCDVEQLLLTNFSFLSDSGSGKTHLGDTTFPIKLQHVKKKKNRELTRVPFRVCAREGGAEMLRQSNAYLCLDS